ncbi:MAG: phospholipase [Alloprevotella sp.]
MTALLLLLLALGIVAALIGTALQWWHSVHNPGSTTEPVIRQRSSDCCGQHEVCEKESLLAAVSKEVVYYDDEELDRFAGRRADNYDREETDEFEEILTTLRSEDVAGWVRSLQLRGIELPEALRDEVILIVGERRQ